MLDLKFGSQFKRDRRLCVKRGYDMRLLSAAVETLRIPATLPPQIRAHNLSGNWAGYQECHLAPVWRFQCVGENLPARSKGLKMLQ